MSYFLYETESSLKEINHKLRAKDLYIQKQEKQIQESIKEINHLQVVISNLKVCFALFDTFLLRDLLLLLTAFVIS